MSTNIKQLWKQYSKRWSTDFANMSHNCWLVLTTQVNIHNMVQEVLKETAKGKQNDINQNGPIPVCPLRYTLHRTIRRESLYSVWYSFYHKKVKGQHKKKCQNQTQQWLNYAQVVLVSGWIHAITQNPVWVFVESFFSRSVTEFYVTDYALTHYAGADFPT